MGKFKIYIREKELAKALGDICLGEIIAETEEQAIQEAYRLGIRAPGEFCFASLLAVLDRE